jgi:GH15 family glucan-1,4-alpha-glucosidase
MSSLELGLIGNGSLAALIDGNGDVVWACVPRLDGNPAFCALLQPVHAGHGRFSVELENQANAHQYYTRNTAVLVTRFHDRGGNELEITDFAPRFRQYGRIYHPLTMIRRVRPIAGTPKMRIMLRPLHDYGAALPVCTYGSNHIRYQLGDFTFRLTSEVPAPYVLEEQFFVLDREYWLVLGPDESLTQTIDTYGREMLDRTETYWREWVRYLALPAEWQDAVIRAAITLKLCQDEGTGAIIAAPTTSIPESAGSRRNWDYRYCWLRDAAFVVRALNRLGATKSMEQYLRYLFNIATADGVLQPMYGVGGEAQLGEYDAPDLAGYRGMGPVRIGNAAYTQPQHDVYGSVILASAQLFFDRRLLRPGSEAEYRRLAPLGEMAAHLFDQPDAGIWEYRGRAHVHTYSAAMCWVACDRLARIASELQLSDDANRWRNTADTMRNRILAESWNAAAGHIADAFGGERLDASLLLLTDIGFISADDPRFVATVDAIGRKLLKQGYLFRYVEADDFGESETAFTVCSFWYIEALAAIGRKEEARTLFDSLLIRRNRLGLLSEDLDPDTGELWGNFPQTYSMVGLIHAAIRLSKRWEDVI